MPIQLKNMDAAPKADFETVSILGLEIPLTNSLPFGGQVELLDLQRRYDAQEIGQFEFLMRMFTVFTWRLPKPERVRYDWLAQQALEPEELTELLDGTSRLLRHVNQSGGGKGKSKKTTN